MPRFSILTSRKRAVIALVHTFLFLTIALVQTAMSRPVAGVSMHRHNGPAAWIMVSVFAVVTAILLALAGVSRRGLERLYFAFCASSASFGLLRSIVGDPPLHVAQYVRIVMLVCAAVVGTIILRVHADVLVLE
jgi:hypothetical protein